MGAVVEAATAFSVLERPGDLPIEQPNAALRIDLKTVKALGLTVLPSLIVAADKMIE